MSNAKHADANARAPAYDLADDAAHANATDFAHANDTANDNGVPQYDFSPDKSALPERVYRPSLLAGDG